MVFSEEYKVRCERCQHPVIINVAEVENGRYACPACNHSNTITAVTCRQYQRRREKERRRGEDVATAQKRIGGLLVLIVLAAILVIGKLAFKTARTTSRQTAATTDPTTRTPPKPEPPAPHRLTPVDPLQVLRQGILGTRTSYDKFKGMTWVDSVQETGIQVTSHVSLAFRPYIGVSDHKVVLFRVYTHYYHIRGEYHDPDWIFYDSVILLNGNREKFKLAIDYGDRDSDVREWGVMESADIRLKPEAVERLSDLMQSPPIDIRFSGKSVVDATLNDEGIQAAQTIIAAWRRLTAPE